MAQVRFFKVAVSALSLSVGMLAAAPAHAQSSQAQTGADESDPLGEIIVTARRREESAQSVPLAISVQTGEQLEQRQVSDLFSLQQLTPSLQAQAQSAQVGATRFTIRGIGTSVVGPQIESSVGMVIDDVPMARPELGNLPFFDLDRVEVLRGPQGMLFGKNAAAGLINIVTNKPKLGVSEFIASATYGNMTDAPSKGHRARLEVAGNVPLGDNAAFRINAFVKHDDAFTANVLPNANDLGMTMYGVRGKLLFEPSDALSIYLSADYAREHGAAESVLIHRRDAPGGTFARFDTLNGITSSPDNNRFAANAPIFAGFEVYGGSAKIDLSLGNHTLSSITSLRRFDFAEGHDQDGVSVDLFDTVRSNINQKQFSTELRLASPTDGALKYQLGVFYLNYTGVQDITFLGGNFLAPAFLPPPGILPPGFRLFGERTVLRLNNKSYAAYGEVQYDITDAFNLTGGIRYTQDDYLYSNTLSLPSPVILRIFSALGGFSSVPNTKLSNDNVSYRIIANYKLSDDVLVYGSYAKGYKGPTFDQFTGLTVSPEIPKVWELGLKSTLLDRKLRFNLALFDETFDGFQTSTLVGTQSRTVSAGKLKARGVEADVTLVPTKGLTISGNLLYNDTKYVNLLVPCYPLQPTGTTGTNVCLPTRLTDVSGNQLAQAPRWVESFAIRYETAISGDWKGFVQGDGYFRSAYNFRTNNDPTTRLGSTSTFGASIGAQRNDGGLGVTLFVRNLFDKRIPSTIGINPASDLIRDSLRGGSYDQFLNADSYRTVGVTVSLKI